MPDRRRCHLRSRHRKQVTRREFVLVYLLSVHPDARRSSYPDGWRRRRSGGSGQVSLAPAPPPVPSSPPSIAGGSEVYRIATDNFPQRIWSHTQDIVYAIGFDAQGRPILGTGNKGNIYRIDSDLVSTLLINASPTQVTAFAAGSKGRLFAATGNVGKIYQVGPELQKTGTNESEAMDAQSFSYWGRVRYKGESNQGGFASRRDRVTSTVRKRTGARGLP